MKFQDTKRDRLEIREGERWTEKKERVSEIHINVDREIDRGKRDTLFNLS